MEHREAAIAVQTAIRELDTAPRIGPRIVMEEAGSGTPLVFVHGIGGNRSNWCGQIDRFSRTHRAVCLDLGGYGDSGDLSDGFGFFDFVDDLRRVLDALEAPRAHLVGLSMGGLVVQAFYAREPQRVISLTLAGSRPGSAPVHPGEQGRAFLDSRLKPLENGQPIAEMAQRVAPTLLSDSAGPAARSAVRASLERLRARNFTRVLRARTSLEPFLALADIAVPTLVIAGEADRVAPLDQVRQMAQEIPGASLQVLAGAGHLMNIEQPGDFNRALEDFLTSLDRAQARPQPASRQAV